jgi:hypothetical protein
MSPRQARISWGMFAGVLGIVLTLTIADAQNRDKQTVEELIPASTVLFIGHDGAATHKGAWEKTAAYEAMYDSGMMAVFDKLFVFVGEQTGTQDNPEVTAAMKHLEDHGATFAVSMPAAQGPPIPQVTIVLHKAAKYDPILSGLVRNFGIFIGAQFEQSDVNERSVTSATIPNTPGIEVGIWAEGEHLVIVAGMNAVSAGVSVAAGEAPNLTTNSLWKKYNYDADGFEVTSVSWLDFESLRKMFGQMPVPTSPGKNVNDVLQTLGLHNLDAVAYQYGYKEKTLWSETAIDDARGSSAAAGQHKRVQGVATRHVGDVGHARRGGQGRGEVRSASGCRPDRGGAGQSAANDRFRSEGRTDRFTGRRGLYVRRSGSRISRHQYRAHGQSRRRRETEIDNQQAAADGRAGLARPVQGPPVRQA